MYVFVYYIQRKRRDSEKEGEGGREWEVIINQRNGMTKERKKEERNEEDKKERERKKRERRAISCNALN